MKTKRERAAIERWKSGTNLAETQPVEAIEEFTKAIELDPKGLLAFFWRAMTYCEIHQYERAESDFSTFIQHYHEELGELLAEAYAGRAEAHFRQGNFQEAIIDYTREIDLNPKSAMGHLDRSIAYHELGKADLACADFDKALQLDATVAELVKNRPTGWNQRREAGESTSTG